jgi:dihydroorotate dehydrogenase electron transfer subunit
LRQHRAGVQAVTEPLPGARLLLLHAPALSQAMPGQFVMARCGTGFDPYLRQAVPIHRLLDQGIGLLVRPENEPLRWLASRRPGDIVDLVGPCGHGFRPKDTADALAVVAQGTGWFPAGALLDRARCPVQLLVSAPTARQLPPPELLPSDVEYLAFVGTEDEPSWLDALADAVNWATHLALAGPSPSATTPRLYRSVAALLSESPLGLCRGRAEAWLWGELHCGLGCCDGCLIETRRGRQRICTDGPVFDLADLVLS